MRLTCLSPLSDFSGVLNYKEIGKNTSQSLLLGVMSARTCNRWFFTVNGVECSMPIDTARSLLWRRVEHYSRGYHWATAQGSQRAM